MAIGPAIAAITGTFSLIKTAVETRDSVKLAQLESDFLKQAIDVQKDCLDLEQRVNTLLLENRDLADAQRQMTERLRELQDFRAQLAEYDLVRLDLGAVVYRKKPGADGVDPQIYLCANCANVSQTTYLQPTRMNRSLECSNGHGEVPVKPGRTYTPTVTKYR